ncbi:SsrA-binding protein SmpB [bacterium]|nr:SsrA-binding protein SmpB [bacterium]
MNKKIITKNKEAFFDYNILEQFETGIVLLGSEVKSIKLGHIQLKGAYCSVRNNEIWLLGANVSLYKPGKEFDTKRDRKLLAKKSEIGYLFGKTNKTNLTIVPTEIYLKYGKIKVEIALATGKKKYDKRESKKKQQTERELRRKYKNIKI